MNYFVSESMMTCKQQQVETKATRYWMIADLLRSLKKKQWQSASDKQGERHAIAFKT